MTSPTNKCSHTSVDSGTSAIITCQFRVHHVPLLLEEENVRCPHFQG